MPKWISLPSEPLKYHPYQTAFWQARRLRLCQHCKLEFECTSSSITCPTCHVVVGLRKYHRFALISGRRGGKGLALDTPIPTPHGWTTMAALQVGDTVFDERGLPTQVTFVSEIHNLPCYRVTFSDGSQITTDNEHRWLVWSRQYRKALRRATAPRSEPEVKLTADLLTTEDHRDAVPLCGPLQYLAKDLPIPPYTLGAWLGDGSSAGASITNIDREILDQIEGDGFAVTPTKDPIQWGIGKQPPVRDIRTGRMLPNGSLCSKLQALGVLNNKHVPRIYLEAAPAQRLALLQGLLDTDGHCDARGRIEFTSTNQNLAAAVHELAVSFGWRPFQRAKRATLYGKDCGPVWVIQFYADQYVFRLARKRQRQRLGFATFFPVRYVTDVTPITSVPTKCIQVAAASSLYLAGDSCIPTHNTRAGAVAVAEELTIPNSIVWACAPTNPKLHRYVIPAFQQLIPPEWVSSWSSEYGDLRLKNGSLLHFQTLEDPDQGRGQGLDAVWIDEASELTVDHWHVLRPSLTERRGVAFLTTSPRGYDWVFDEFYHRAEEGFPGYWACKYATSENPIISSAELTEARATMPDTMFRQEYEADFVIFTGSVYGSAVDPQILRDEAAIRHLIPEWPELAPWRQVLVGLDTGADHPFGAVKLVSTEHGLVVVGEYLERDKAYIQHAAQLKRLASSPQVRWAINKNERQGIFELAQHDIMCQKAENDVVAGTERVKTWLHQRKLWFVEPLCKQTIKQLKAYRWDDSSTKDGQLGKQKVYKKDDELPDGLRYALMTWPQLPEAIVAPNTGRDISHFSGEQQASIQRLRRIDKGPEDPTDVVGDFYL